MADYVVTTVDSILLQYGNGGAAPRYVKFEYGAALVVKFQVDDVGDVTITGNVLKAGTISLNNSSGAGDLLHIDNTGVVKVNIGNNGHGDFSVGGLQTVVVAADPNGARTGAPGDMVLWDNGAGTYKWCVNVTAPNTWKHVVIA